MPSRLLYTGHCLRRAAGLQDECLVITNTAPDGICSTKLEVGHEQRRVFLWSPYVRALVGKMNQRPKQVQRAAQGYIFHNERASLGSQHALHLTHYLTHFAVGQVM